MGAISDVKSYVCHVAKLHVYYNVPTRCLNFNTGDIYDF